MSNIHTLQQLDESIQMEQLSSGLTVVHVPLSGNDHRFYLGAIIKAGARYELASQTGVAHFLEHMMFRGSRRYPNARRLAKAFEWFGGDWNAATGYEHTEYWYSGTIDGYKELISLFADFFCYPMMNDLDTERDVIRRELQKEMNEYGLMTDLDYHTYHQLFPRSNLDRSILGCEESIQSIRKKDLEDYRRTHYHPKNIVICAVGCQREDNILGKLKQEFRYYRSRTNCLRKPLRAVKAPRKGPLVQWIRHPDNEYQVQLSFVCQHEWSREHTGLELLARVLADGYSSRLGQRLREQLGLVYSIDAQANLMHDTGTVDIYSSVGLTELPRFLKETLAILAKLRRQGLSKSELDLWKRRAKADVSLLASTPEMLGYRISWSLLSGKQPSLAKMLDEIDRISAADIQRLSDKTFRAANCSLSLLGPENNQLRNRVEAILSAYD